MPYRYLPRSSMPVASFKKASVLCAMSALAGTALCAADPAARPHFGSWGVDLTSLDKDVRPGDNFFEYVNGTWLKSAQIPADRSSTGAFQDLQILSEQRLRSIVEELQARPYGTLTDEERKLRDLYEAFEDTAQIEGRALAPIQGDLTYLAGLKTLDDVARAMGSVRLSTASIYGLGIGVDDKNPDRYSINLGQSGLGLPDRDYYLRDDTALTATREAYRKYLSTMLRLADTADSDSDADARAEAVFELEKKIAQVQWNRADRRDADKTYNPMSVSALKALAEVSLGRVFLRSGRSRVGT
jgi:putative endopeptidase